MKPRGLLLLLAAAALAAPAHAQKLESEEQRTFYALGLAIAGSLETFALTEAELDLVKSGITDGVLGKKPKVSLGDFKDSIRRLVRARAAKALEAERAAAAAFLKEAAAQPGAVRTQTGLVFQELRAGAGPSPKAEDRVKVHYHGTLRDGTVFDSSVTRGEPATFPLDGVIPCWTEAVQKMKVGGKAKITCPSDVAYGNAGSPPRIKPGAALQFEVELLEITAAERKPADSK